MSASKRLVTAAGPRYWEIDALRGVAIVMMVIFHLMWDLWAFQILPDVVLYAGFWKYFQRTTAITFLLLVGVSLTVSYRQAQGQSKSRTPLWPKFVGRGLRIFGVGMGFTLFGWLTGFGYVHFGVLHLIGAAIMLSYPLLGYRRLNLALWAILFALGSGVERIAIDHNWLLWLGLHTRDYAPLDYFPLIPWFGVVLLGIYLGNTFYQEEGRLIPIPDLNWFILVRWLRFLGRHSLIIYVIHQPILLALLFVTGLIQR